MRGRKRNSPRGINSIQHLLIIGFKLAPNLLVALTRIIDELDRVVKAIEQNINAPNSAHHSVQRVDRKMTIVVVQDPRFGGLD